MKASAASAKFTSLVITLRCNVFLKAITALLWSTYTSWPWPITVEVILRLLSFKYLMTLDCTLRYSWADKIWSLIIACVLIPFLPRPLAWFLAGRCGAPPVLGGAIPTPSIGGGAMPTPFIGGGVLPGAPIGGCVMPTLAGGGVIPTPLGGGTVPTVLFWVLLMEAFCTAALSTGTKLLA